MVASERASEGASCAEEGVSGVHESAGGCPALPCARPSEFKPVAASPRWSSLDARKLDLDHTRALAPAPPAGLPAARHRL